VVDPSQHAKRKIQKHLKKRDTKRQKVTLIKAAKRGAPVQSFERDFKRAKRMP